MRSFCFISKQFMTFFGDYLIFKTMFKEKFDQNCFKSKSRQGKLYIMIFEK